MRRCRTGRWLGALAALVTVVATTGWTLAPYLHHHHDQPLRTSLERSLPAAPACGDTCPDHAHHAAAHAQGLFARSELSTGWRPARHVVCPPSRPASDPWLPPPGKPPRSV